LTCFYRWLIEVSDLFVNQRLLSTNDKNMSTISLNNTDVLTTTENIHVKLQFNDEFRRFFIPHTIPSIKFNDLESKIKSLLRITENEISIKYQDEENEWITISSDVELETGLLISGNRQLFRLLCIVKQDSKTITNTTGEDGENVPHWKKYKNRGQDRNRENFQRKDRKWKKNYDRKPIGDSENNLTPEPSNLQEDNANEENEPKKFRGERRQKREKRGKRDRKGDGERRKKKYRDDEEDGDSNGSSSESNSDIALMTLDEIKVEISKLKEEESILKEKVRAAKESWKNAKDSVKVKRRDENVHPDKILEMREEMMNRKKEKKRVQVELRITRGRMNKLHEAAETKQV